MPAVDMNYIAGEKNKSLFGGAYKVNKQLSILKKTHQKTK